MRFIILKLLNNKLKLIRIPIQNCIFELMDPKNTETQKFKFNTMALVGLMVIMLPLSIKLFFPVISTVIIFPSELLIGILALIFLYDLSVKLDFSLLDKDFLKHPITVLVFSYLLINGIIG